MSFPLENKFALVTGASGGIGSAVAKRLAADGASVLVHYGSSRTEAEAVVAAIRTTGVGEAEVVSADLGRRDGPTALLAQLDPSFGGRFAGRLDVLVNNAGALDFGGLPEATDESFDHLFNLNVRAVFQLSREAARRMTRTGWGRIINLGSVFGEAIPTAGLSLYGASKFAVHGLTRGWSRDLGPAGITVNNVQPALIQPEPQPASGPVVDAMQRFASVGRLGKPGEVAEVVAYLASPRAGFINGASMNVDGGWGA